jgi:hypothetical protein
MSLYEQLKAAGVQIDNNSSDLYFEVTQESLSILAQHPDKKQLAKHFVNQRPPNKGKDWIEVPFAYLPWWENKNKQKI